VSCVQKNVKIDLNLTRTNILPHTCFRKALQYLQIHSSYASHGRQCWVTLHTAGWQFTSTLFVWLISHQPAVLFSQNKPATSNEPTILFLSEQISISQTNMPRCTSCSLGLAFKLTRAVQLLNQRRLTATCVGGGGTETTAFYSNHVLPTRNVNSRDYISTGISHEVSLYFLHKRGNSSRGGLVQLSEYATVLNSCDIHT
jgi:hypothetical protein